MPSRKLMIVCSYAEMGVGARVETLKLIEPYLNLLMVFSKGLIILVNQRIPYMVRHTFGHRDRSPAATKVTALHAIIGTNHGVGCAQVHGLPGVWLGGTTAVVCHHTGVSHLPKSNGLCRIINVLPLQLADVARSTTGTSFKTRTKSCWGSKTW